VSSPHVRVRDAKQAKEESDCWKTVYVPIISLLELLRKKSDRNAKKACDLGDSRLAPPHDRHRAPFRLNPLFRDQARPLQQLQCLPEPRLLYMAIKQV
jgi:hypothetical protein